MSQNLENESVKNITLLKTPLPQNGFKAAFVIKVGVSARIKGHIFDMDENWSQN